MRLGGRLVVVFRETLSLVVVITAYWHEQISDERRRVLPTLGLGGRRSGCKTARKRALRELET